MNAFDKNLRRLRIRRNLKQEDLAELVHVTRQTVSGWETGRRQPDLQMLQKLAEALDADVHELIYGTKPGTYPRYQRRYVISTTVFGGIAATGLLFRLLLWPYLKVLAHTHHLGALVMICTILLPQAGSFAFGALLPGMVQLWTPVRMRKRHRQWTLAAGLTALLPSVLFWLSVPPFSRWILYSFGSALLCYILPAIGGFCILLGALSEGTDPQ